MPKVTQLIQRNWLITLPLIPQELNIVRHFLIFRDTEYTKIFKERKIQGRNSAFCNIFHWTWKINANLQHLLFLSSQASVVRACTFRTSQTKNIGLRRAKLLLKGLCRAGGTFLFFFPTEIFQLSILSQYLFSNIILSQNPKYKIRTIILSHKCHCTVFKYFVLPKTLRCWHFLIFQIYLLSILTSLFSFSSKLSTNLSEYCYKILWI